MARRRNEIEEFEVRQNHKEINCTIKRTMGQIKKSRKRISCTKTDDGREETGWQKMSQESERVRNQGEMKSRDLSARGVGERERRGGQLNKKP